MRLTCLVLKYEHKIVNLVMRYVRDPEQALDITQEAFIKAYRALPRFRGDSAFYTWLYRIAVNTAKNLPGGAATAANRTLSWICRTRTNMGCMRNSRKQTTPEARVAESRELQETLERAIQSLPDDLRTAIVLAGSWMA